MKKEIKHQRRYRRHKRIRAKVFGTTIRPRLAVFRSNQHIYSQIINDELSRTLVTASDLEIKKISSSNCFTFIMKNYLRDVEKITCKGF